MLSYFQISMVLLGSVSFDTDPDYDSSQFFLMIRIKFSYTDSTDLDPQHCGEIPIFCSQFR